MNSVKNKLISGAFFLLAVLSCLTIFIVPTFAHGGEDHGDSKPAAVSSNKGTIVQTVKAGDFEVLLKHAQFEPDAPQVGRLFVTRFATNEAVGDAVATVEISAPDGKTYQAKTAKADAPGSYNVQLPPLPVGTYTILARLSAAGKSQTAAFSGVSVEHSATEAVAEGVSSWFRTALSVLATIAFFGLFGALMFFAWRFAARERTTRETVSV